MSTRAEHQAAKARAALAALFARQRPMISSEEIAADVDGDGRVELISRTDQVGATPPARAYDLFAATPKTEPKSDTERRFYMGGSIYENWAAVPESYKNSNSNRPDPARSTASIFSFRF